MWACRVARCARVNWALELERALGRVTGRSEAAPRDCRQVALLVAAKLLQGVVGPWAVYV